MSARLRRAQQASVSVAGVSSAMICRSSGSARSSLARLQVESRHLPQDAAVLRRGLGGCLVFCLGLLRFVQEFAARCQRDRGLFALERFLGFGDQRPRLVGLAHVDQELHDRDPNFIGLGIQVTGLQERHSTANCAIADHFRVGSRSSRLARLCLEFQTMGQMAVHLSLTQKVLVVLAVGGNRFLDVLLGFRDVAREDLHVDVLLAHLAQERTLLFFQVVEQLPGFCRSAPAAGGGARCGESRRCRVLPCDRWHGYRIPRPDRVRPASRRSCPPERPGPTSPCGLPGPLAGNRGPPGAIADPSSWIARGCGWPCRTARRPAAAQPLDLVQAFVEFLQVGRLAFLIHAKIQIAEKIPQMTISSVLVRPRGGSRSGPNQDRWLECSRRQDCPRDAFFRNRSSCRRSRPASSAPRPLGDPCGGRRNCPASRARRGDRPGSFVSA